MLTFRNSSIGGHHLCTFLWCFSIVLFSIVQTSHVMFLALCTFSYTIFLCSPH
jgi:hypothetical protein